MVSVTSYSTGKSAERQQPLTEEVVTSMIAIGIWQQ
jgi:hypothetical protein